MRKLISVAILLLFIGSFTVACYLRPEPTPSDTAESDSPGIIRPTETPYAWATLAFDQAATLSPTPTMQPIPTRLDGRIAFQSNRDGSLEIYVMNADGTAVSRLTNNPAVDVFPNWSPRGDRIAFTSDRDGFPNIYTVNPDGTNLVKLTDAAGNNALPAFSPDGNQIAFVSDRDGNDEIYLMGADGGNVRRLTKDTGQDLFPAWSPDGNWIAFSTTRDVNSEIYKMRADGSELTRLTNDPAADTNPAWSPDGTRIAFISRRDGFSNLYVMDTDGGNVQQLTFYKSVVEVPTWSPDSNSIAFASDMEGNRNIFVISANGAGLNRLTDQALEDFYPSWSPNIGYLLTALAEPTPAPEGVCVNAADPTYGYSPENPVKIGFDPRGGHEGEGSPDVLENCLPWLLGPQGQPVTTTLLNEVPVTDSILCEVAVSYEGREGADILYFDIFNYEQPRAPVGYTCGSPSAYLAAITEAIYQ